MYSGPHGDVYNLLQVAVQHFSKTSKKSLYFFFLSSLRYLNAICETIYLLRLSRCLEGRMIDWKHQPHAKVGTSSSFCIFFVVQTNINLHVGNITFLEPKVLALSIQWPESICLRICVCLQFVWLPPWKRRPCIWHLCQLFPEFNGRVSIKYELRPVFCNNLLFYCIQECYKVFSSSTRTQTWLSAHHRLSFLPRSSWGKYSSLIWNIAFYLESIQRIEFDITHHHVLFL